MIQRLLKLIINTLQRFVKDTSDEEPMTTIKSEPLPQMLVVFFDFLKEQTSDSLLFNNKDGERHIRKVDSKFDLHQLKTKKWSFRHKMTDGVFWSCEYDDTKEINDAFNIAINLLGDKASEQVIKEYREKTINIVPTLPPEPEQNKIPSDLAM